MNEYTPGTIKRRIEASITTAVPIVLYILLVSFLNRAMLPFHEYALLSAATQAAADVLYIVVTLGIPLLVIIVDGSRANATYGMRVRKLRFGDAEGGSLAMTRCALRIVCGLLLIPLFPISWAFAIMDERHRTAADRLCKTTIWEA